MPIAWPFRTGREGSCQLWFMHFPNHFYIMGSNWLIKTKMPNFNNVQNWINTIQSFTWNVKRMTVVSPIQECSEYRLLIGWSLPSLSLCCKKMNIFMNLPRNKAMAFDSQIIIHEFKSYINITNTRRTFEWLLAQDFQPSEKGDFQCC